MLIGCRAALALLAATAPAGLALVRNPLTVAVVARAAALPT